MDPGYFINVDYITRLVNRFTLQKTPLTNFPVWLPTMVLPVTQADELLRDWDVHNSTIALVGTGVLDLIGPGDEERWRVYAIHCSRSTGDRTVNGYWVADADGEGALIEDFTAASAFHTGMLNQPIILDRNWNLQLSLTGGSSDGGWITRFLYTKEKAYTTT